MAPQGSGGPPRKIYAVRPPIMQPVEPEKRPISGPAGVKAYWDGKSGGKRTGSGSGKGEILPRTVGVLQFFHREKRRKMTLCRLVFTGFYESTIHSNVREREGQSCRLRVELFWFFASFCPGLFDCLYELGASKHATRPRAPSTHSPTSRRGTINRGHCFNDQRPDFAARDHRQRSMSHRRATLLPRIGPPRTLQHGPLFDLAPSPPSPGLRSARPFAGVGKTPTGDPASSCRAVTDLETWTAVRLRAFTILGPTSQRATTGRGRCLTDRRPCFFASGDPGLRNMAPGLTSRLHRLRPGFAARNHRLRLVRHRPATLLLRIGPPRISQHAPWFDLAPSPPSPGLCSARSPAEVRETQTGDPASSCRALPDLVTRTSV